MIYRSGQGLRETYNTPAVQKYCNGLQAKELNKEKDIFRPGALRKVFH